MTTLFTTHHRVCPHLLSLVLLLLCCLTSWCIAVEVQGIPDQPLNSTQSDAERLYSTPHEMCPIEKFNQTLHADAFIDQLWQNRTDKSEVVQRMLSRYDALSCDCGNNPADPASAKWPLHPDHKLIVAASEGTTGSTWLSEQFRTRCKVIRASHKFLELDLKGAAEVTPLAYISDTPVLVFFCRIFFSFPSALIIQYLRDADDWAQKRFKMLNQSDEWQDTWSAATPCSLSDENEESRTWPKHHDQRPPSNKIHTRGFDAAVDYAVMATFVKCVTPPERYVAFNVFKQTNEESLEILDRDVCSYVDSTMQGATSHSARTVEPKPTHSDESLHSRLGAMLRGSVVTVGQ